MEKFKALGFEKVDLFPAFWEERQKINISRTMKAVRDRFIDTHRFEAFTFNYTFDSDYKPHVFWDSDVAKWIESAAYIYQKYHEDINAQEYLKNAEQLIDLIIKNQEESGYFNIYFQQIEPENRFVRRDAHELYCAGHLIEAAVAYFCATGKDNFLKAMCKYADYIEKVFVTEKTAEFKTPGHEEIELALVKLYECTKEERYLKLSKHFLDERGRDKDEACLTDWCKEQYNQSHLPVRKQRTAEGHSVRACYLYSAMADLARICGDQELFEACDAIFDDIMTKKMYITGGIGSSREGEAFTVPFDLPNSRAYAETCAAISLAMFAKRMSLINPDSKYADILEKVIYNGFLSGLSLDGTHFFYENPLEICLSERNRNVSMSHEREAFPLTQRLEVFDCSCCPPNVTRFIASIADNIYSYSENEIYVHQYISNQANFEILGKKICISQKTQYPFDGLIQFEIKGLSGKKLFLRIPEWCDNFNLQGAIKGELVKGYLVLPVNCDEFVFTLDLKMNPCFVRSNLKVRGNIGRLALMRGPLVYCLESVDNGENLNEIFADEEAELEVIPPAETNDNISVIETMGYRQAETETERLYTAKKPKYIKQKLVFRPYFQFANRGESDMLVFVNSLRR